MKKIIFALMILLLLSVAGCRKAADANVVKEPKNNPLCFVPEPVPSGDCGKVFGIYYDAEENRCKTLNGCSVEGEIPFKLSLSNPMQTCTELCVN
ncbi:hypothetical protein JXC34_00670 [Candidatus Woesearchaeota archaeon]|nr:hypothetical protein [Candidatus Woesearchaeota archaeon]